MSYYIGLTTTEDDEADYRRDYFEDRESAASARCECMFPDWPGQCPGSENCPCAIAAQEVVF